MANWCISSQFIPILCIHNIAGGKQGREHMNISRVKVVMNSNWIYTCFFFCSNSLLMYLYPAILSLWGCFHCLGQFVSFQPWTQTLPMHKGFTGNNAAGNPALMSQMPASAVSHISYCCSCTALNWGKHRVASSMKPCYTCTYRMRQQSF